jgi:hypothetical protein
MEYNKLQRLARSKNIRITKNTRSGRRYLTAAELKKKLKRRKLRSKKIAARRVGFLSGLFSGLLGRSTKGRKIRKLRKKLKKRPKRRLCKCRKACKCPKGMKYRKGRAIKSGALLALKTVATGAAIQLGAEAAKRALQM